MHYNTYFNACMIQIFYIVHVWVYPFLYWDTLCYSIYIYININKYIYILDVKMELKLHLYSITWVTSALKPNEPGSATWNLDFGTWNLERGY